MSPVRKLTKTKIKFPPLEISPFSIYTALYIKSGEKKIFFPTRFLNSFLEELPRRRLNALLRIGVSDLRSIKLEFPVHATADAMIQKEAWEKLPNT